ncbi:MAG: radical SAM protein, partial [Candidatus Methylomirabilis sp.]|nr:radical SAM protein [Deltaproteobacteria bacterium]
RLSWKCTTTVNTVTEPLLRLMKRAGCHLVSFGFESGTQEALDRLGKGITLEQSRRAAEMAAAAGLETVGFFMLGIDGETPEAVDRTIRFSRELDVDYAQFMIYQAEPGGGSAAASEDPFEEDNPFTTASSGAALQNEGPFTAEALARFSGRAYRSFYARPAYWLKTLRKVRTPGELGVKAGAGFSLLFYSVTRNLLARLRARGARAPQSRML